jgi:hypothetical protein
MSAFVGLGRDGAPFFERALRAFGTTTAGTSPAPDTVGATATDALDIL